MKIIKYILETFSPPQNDKLSHKIPTFINNLPIGQKLPYEN